MALGHELFLPSGAVGVTLFLVALSWSESDLTSPRVIWFKHRVRVFSWFFFLLNFLLIFLSAKGSGKDLLNKFKTNFNDNRKAPGDSAKGTPRMPRDPPLLAGPLWEGWQQRKFEEG